MKEVLDVGEVIVGNIGEELESIIDSEKYLYKPFVEVFNDVNSFLKWNKSSKKPLIRNKWLCVVYDNINYENFLVNYNRIIDNYKKHIRVIYLVSSKGSFKNLNSIENECFKIKRSYDIIKENFFKEVKNQFFQIENNELLNSINKVIQNRIGLNKKYLITYSEILNKDNTVNEFNILSKIKEVFPKTRIESVESILYNVLTRNKRYVRTYYQATNKYSEQWLNNYFLQILESCIFYQNKIIKSEIGFSDIYKNDFTKKNSRLIRDISHSDMIFLSMLLKSKNIAPIETYMSNTFKEYIDNKSIEFPNVKRNTQNTSIDF